MEYCPEVAVLHGAFLLADIKAGKFSDLKKHDCRECVIIIQKAVEEISRGLQVDHNPEELLLWKQKLYGLLLYALVKKKYRKNEARTPEGAVPLKNSMDMLSDMLPTFSCHFFFQLMWQCSWTCWFLESLSCLDFKTASLLLQDAFAHFCVGSSSEVTGDDHFIAMVTDKLFSCCLSVPLDSSLLCYDLLEPLSQRICYVQTVYPAQVINTLDTKTETNVEVSTDGVCENEFQKSGETFWCKYMERNAEFVIEKVSNYLGNKTKDLCDASLSPENYRICLQHLAKMTLFWYVSHISSNRFVMDRRQEECEGVPIGSVTCKEGILPSSGIPPSSGISPSSCVVANDFLDKWFINNFYINDESNSSSSIIGLDFENKESCYSLNFKLIRFLSEKDLHNLKATLNSVLIGCISNLLGKICRFQDDCYSKTSDVQADSEQNSDDLQADSEQNSDDLQADSEQNSDDLQADSEQNSDDLLTSLSEICVISELRMKTKVLFRVLEHINSYCDPPVNLKGMAFVATSQDDDFVLCESESWKSDVTLEALLWRIKHQFHQHAVCLDMLMLDKCVEFWRYERLYTVLHSQLPVLHQIGRVISMIRIWNMLVKSICQRETIQKLENLIMSAFFELTFLERDMVIKEIYCNKEHLSAQFKAGRSGERDIMNVFNKLTTDMDNQVLGEVLWLSLMDPMMVIQTTIKMCIKNQEQAHNCAEVLQSLFGICHSCHSMNHPTTSLLGFLVKEFLHGTSLSDKEQQHFRSFVTQLMKTPSNDRNAMLLHPTEFLVTAILPYLCVDQLKGSEFVMSCDFTLDLLLAALESGCNKGCDWTKFDFQPITVVVTLADIIHECVTLWDSREQVQGSRLGPLPDVDGREIPLTTEDKKAVVKENALSCLKQLCCLVDNNYVMVRDIDIAWLLTNMKHHHWTMKLYLTDFVASCGHVQYKTEWLKMLDKLLQDTFATIMPILQFASISSTFGQHILDKAVAGSIIDYQELCVVLIQVLPNLTGREFENLVGFIHGLLSTERVECFTYRLQSTRNLPVDFSGVRPVLYLTQLLSDVMMALSLALGSRGTTSAVRLHHVVQGYVSCIKKRCEFEAQGTSLLQFSLCEIFHHVCLVTLTLPPEVMNSTLVLLLHIITEFKDISLTTGQRNLKSHSKRYEQKVVKDFENGLIAVVKKLPEQCEEKQMMMKKLLHNEPMF